MTKPTPTAARVPVGIDFDGSFKYYELAETIEIGSLKSYSLSQNYPNPFNPATNIAYTLSQNSGVRLEVFNMLGQRVSVLVNEKQSPGNYSVQFDGKNLESGTYIYRLTTENNSVSKRMQLPQKSWERRSIMISPKGTTFFMQKFGLII